MEFFASVRESCRDCFQTFVGAGDIFDAEMDSSDDDDADVVDRRKRERSDDVPENKGDFCEYESWK